MGAEGVHNIQSPEEFTQLEAENKSAGDALMVVDFFATWCGPCKVIAPQVVSFSKKYENVKFFKVDVDEVSQPGSDYDVRAMPTFLLLKGGKEVAKVVGANPAALESAIKSNL